MKAMRVGTSRARSKKLVVIARDQADYLVPGVGLEHVAGNDNKEVIDSITLTLSTLLTFEGFTVQNRVQGAVKELWRDCAR
jgi:hypothetical protein